MVVQEGRTGMFWIALAGTMWGTAGVATQSLYTLNQTTPFSISFLRLLVASPILLLVSYRLLGRRMFVIRRSDVGIMLLMGVLMALDQAIYALAIEYVGVTLSTLVTICCAPVFVALVSRLLFAERLSRKTWVAFICALIGVVMLIVFQPGADYASTSLVGILIALLGAVFYAAVIVLGRSIAGHYHPLQTWGIGFTAGMLVLGVIAIATGFVGVDSPQGWLLIVYLGVVPTVMAYGLFLVGMRSTSASVASIVVLLEPLTATFLSGVLFGERLSLLGVAGGVMLIGAILLLAFAE